MTKERRICPRCGQVVEPDWNYCDICGLRLSDEGGEPVNQYLVVGRDTGCVYGSYATEAEAFRLGINQKFSKRRHASNEFDELKTKVMLTFPEPVFVARLDHSVEGQRPYTGSDTRVREINERESWEKAHRVREVLG